MPRPRSQQISLSDTPYYHCVSRCVRRAFLCGEDQYSGQSFEHRRGWVERRLLFLGQVFCIEVCAYAVMSNHTHVVLHINDEKVAQLTDKEVIARWHRLFKGTLLTRKFMQSTETPLTSWELQSIAQTASVYRQRLGDISWFMRCLNEHIARQANKEDNCSGRFWEGRFKSQALLDGVALAACMAYVDLNPIRANMASTPEASAHTSIQLRIKALLQGKQPNQLVPFVGNPRANMPPGLPFPLNEYLHLVEITGKILHPHKPGKLDDTLLPLLTRLGLDKTQWLLLTTELEAMFSNAIGKDAMQNQFNRQKLQSG